MLDLMSPRKPSRKHSQTRPQLWLTAGKLGTKQARGLRAQCQVSAGMQGRAITQTYSHVLGSQQMPWVAVSCVPQVRGSQCTILIDGWVRNLLWRISLGRGGLARLWLDGIVAYPDTLRTGSLAWVHPCISGKARLFCTDVV